MSDIKKRMQSLIKTLTTDLHERDEQMAVALLAALAGLNVFLLGPPGTAKSLLARRLTSAFADCQEKGKYFEYLMQRFSTPDELFGPVSLTALKQDKYERKTEGFLPTAHFAFLDEIWKSGPGILNTLLTLINEKLFRNGAETVKVPLKALIAASNETPPQGQGLDALYDRFVVRMFVPPMENPENFESLLKSQTIESHVDCKDNVIMAEELKKWREEIHAVKLSEETLQIIHDIRVELGKSTKKSDLPVYVSERRWKQAAYLLKAAAFFCGREETNLSDVLLLRHCLWTTDDNREKVMVIVQDAVENTGFKIKAEISEKESVNEKKKLDKDAQKELFHDENEYKTVPKGGKDCVEVTIKWAEDMNRDISDFEHERYLKKTNFYIPIEKCQSLDKFHAFDDSGEEKPYIVFWFDQTGECWAKADEEYSVSLYKKSKTQWETQKEMKIPLPVKNRKGTQKSSVSPRVIKTLREDIDKVAKEFDNLIEEIESRRQTFSLEMDTPFVTPEYQKISLAGIDKQIDSMRTHREECKMLLEQVNGAEAASKLSMK